MPRPRHHHSNPAGLAAESLVRVTPLLGRWIERLLAAHEPPLTVAQYMALEAAAEDGVVGADLAQRAAVSPAAVSQLLGGLEEAGLMARARAEDDRRRQPLTLSERGERTLVSARLLLRGWLAGLLGELPPHEADALADGLARLDALLSGRAPPPRPPRPPGPKHRQPPPPGPKHRRPPPDER
jgi:DNA-binding MarR family transcriptional regulator